MFKRFPPFLLPILSGTLMGLSWYFHLSLLALVAWVPLLQYEELFRSGRIRKGTYFLFIYLGFLVWNLLVSWWIVNASLIGSIPAFVFNSLFMALVFYCYTQWRQIFALPWSQWFLIPLWMAWEYGHTLWDLTWTWLTLGNVFGNMHQAVQWYSFTGTSGGTLWILVSNILCFKLIQKPVTFKSIRIYIEIITVPLFISFFMYQRDIPVPSETIQVVAVQPNIDPYTEKFYSGFNEQFEKAAKMTVPQLDSTVDLLVFPETFISENLNESVIHESEELDWFRGTFLGPFPDMSIIVGGSTYNIFKPNEEKPVTARYDARRDVWFDFYNTGLCVTQDCTQVYHKSKLVPGVERMPFPAVLGFLESFAINLGGTMGSLGTQENRSVFIDKKAHRSAPVICYESVYPDYVREYVKAGAQLITIITNDGWWGNTPGHRQHKDYARLRAIECGRSIVRSANTGISCFVAPNGDTKDETAYWKPALIKSNVALYDHLTFFVKYGDLLSYLACFVSFLLILWRILVFMARFVTK